MTNIAQSAQALASDKNFLDSIISFIDKGGIFIYFIILCSIAAIAVMLYQAMILVRHRVIPDGLVDSINSYVSQGGEESIQSLNSSSKASPSLLQKLCDVVLERHDRKDVEIQEAVQVIAREEIHKLQVGIPFLEVIIAIAPLLGLLGTATGLFTVFEGVGAGEEKYEEMARGISEALITTVSGLAVAVPAVIAHGYFNRKIDSYAARLEVVMDKFVGAYSIARNLK
ncbi:MAG: MotA/TolQ/ExbB proton channel family protein [Rubritalea sp.]|jgi:biopolymer transport protein ExbB